MIPLKVFRPQPSPSPPHPFLFSAVLYSHLCDILNVIFDPVPLLPSELLQFLNLLARLGFVASQKSNFFFSLFCSDMEISKQKHTLQSTLGEYQSCPPLWLQVSWLGCHCFSCDFWSFAFWRSSNTAYTIVLEWLSCCYVWMLPPWWKCYFFLVMIGFYF